VAMRELGGRAGKGMAVPGSGAERRHPERKRGDGPRALFVSIPPPVRITRLMQRLKRALVIPSAEGVPAFAEGFPAMCLRLGRNRNRRLRSHMDARTLDTPERSLARAFCSWLFPAPLTGSSTVASLGAPGPQRFKDA
jgi:hypothetical protein